MMTLRYVVAIAAVALLAGCSRKIEVQSDTTWSGKVNKAFVVGEGNRTYTLKPSEKCFQFQKGTEAGYLRVKFKHGSGSEPSTTEPFGTIEGCAD